MQNLDITFCLYSLAGWFGSYLVANPQDRFSHDKVQMGLVARKPVFQVSVEARLKAVYSAIETSWKIEIWPVTNLDMLLSKKRIIKALIRLCGCAGWTAPLLFANPRRQVFLRRGPYHIGTKTSSHVLAHLFFSESQLMIGSTFKVVLHYNCPRY